MLGCDTQCFGSLVEESIKAAFFLLRVHIAFHKFHVKEQRPPIMVFQYTCWITDLLDITTHHDR